MPIARLRNFWPNFVRVFLIDFAGISWRKC